MYIPSVKEAFQQYSYYNLHDNAWFVGEPNAREVKILDRQYPQIHYWGSVIIFLVALLFGGATFLIGLIYWWAVGIIIFGGVAAIANAPLGFYLRQQVRKDLIEKKALIIGDYYHTPRDIRIEAIKNTLPPRVDWEFLSSRDTFKLEVDGFLRDPAVLEAVKLYKSGILNSEDERGALKRALEERAKAMFENIDALHYDKPLSLDAAILGLTGMPRQASIEQE